MDKLCPRSRRRCFIILQYILLILLLILLINIYLFNNDTTTKTSLSSRTKQHILSRKMEPMFNVLKSRHNESDIVYVRKLAIKRRDKATSLAYIESEENVLQRATDYMETTVKPNWFNYRSRKPQPYQVPWSPDLMVPERFWGVTNVVVPRYRYTLNHPAICNIPNLHTLVLVTSYIHSQHNRMAIRRSWGRIQKIYNVNVKVVFLLGAGSAYYQTLAEAEDAQFQDMVQQDFVDGFGQRTLKIMMALSWFSDYCFNAQYVVIISDSVIPNIYKIIKFLRSFDQEQDLYVGVVRYGDSPHVVSSDRYMSNVTWNVKGYPPFCERPFWILSTDVADKMAAVMPYTAWMYPEDVYLGVLSVKLGIKPMDYKRSMIHSLSEDPRRVLADTRSGVIMADVVDDGNLASMITLISDEIDDRFRETDGLIRRRGRIHPVTTGDVFLEQ